MRAFTGLLLLAGSLSAADVPPAAEDEAFAKVWSAAKAADALDVAAVNWARDRQCVTCHTTLPYLMARPLLKTSDGEKEVRQFLEDDVAAWNAGGKPKGDAYVVATAAALVFHDAKSTGRLHPLTKDALDRIWAVQKKTGEWNWIKCDWPPLEHDDYFGAVLAAVAVGNAPGKYAESTKAQAGLGKLKTYLTKNAAPDLHHRALLLWASQSIDGLMDAPAKAATIAALKKLQHEDGGWCLPSLGKYARRDKTANDPEAASDGYGTGFTVFILRQAGVPANDSSLVRGAKWLKANQRESGRWFTRSLNTDKAHYISNAGSAFAVMALDACGEVKPAGNSR